MYSSCCGPTEVDCCEGEAAMDGALGRGVSSSLNGTKAEVLDAAPKPPSCSSISRAGGEDVWTASEARKRILLADIAASNIELSFSSAGFKGDEDTDRQHSQYIGIGC